MLTGGQGSQGFPQALPREQQHEERLTPTPTSTLHASPPRPRGTTSRKQLPTRGSETGEKREVTVKLRQKKYVSDHYSAKWFLHI